MTDQPLSWHYGLMAERWAEFITETPELPFFKKTIERFGQPVLDVACGAGRLLLPLLHAGIDIDGCDLSADMLEQCRKKAASDGYNPHLVAQPMHSFDLPRRYKTIYICGSFGLGGSRAQDLATLRRCYHHLQDGGGLIVNIEAEYTSSESWNLWLKENREKLPGPWSQPGKGDIAADGSEHFASFRLVEVDPLDQSFIRQVHLEKWLNGQLMAAEEYTLRGNMYFKNELLLMLQIAGFREISVLGDYKDEPATADHEELVFIAVR